MRSVFLWIAWFGMLALLIVTIIPVQFRPETMLPAGVERFGAFAVAGLLFCLAYPGRAALVGTLIVLAAGFLELAQLFSPTREPAVMDFAAKAAGGIFGTIMGQLFTKLPMHLRRRGW